MDSPQQEACPAEPLAAAAQAAACGRGRMPKRARDKKGDGARTYRASFRLLLGEIRFLSSQFGDSEVSGDFSLVVRGFTPALDFMLPPSARSPQACLCAINDIVFTDHPMAFSFEDVFQDGILISPCGSPCGRPHATGGRRQRLPPRSACHMSLGRDVGDHPAALKDVRVATWQGAGVSHQVI